jgi:hypothetical protein
VCCFLSSSPSPCPLSSIHGIGQVPVSGLASRCFISGFKLIQSPVQLRVISFLLFMRCISIGGGSSLPSHSA